jgi:hypothetical protein
VHVYEDGWSCTSAITITRTFTSIEHVDVHANVYEHDS